MSVCQRSPAGLVETQIIGPPLPEVLIQSVWGEDLIICASNELPSDVDAAGPGATL